MKCNQYFAAIKTYNWWQKYTVMLNNPVTYNAILIGFDKVSVTITRAKMRS